MLTKVAIEQEKVSGLLIREAIEEQLVQLGSKYLSQKFLHSLTVSYGARDKPLVRFSLRATEGVRHELLEAVEEAITNVNSTHDAELLSLQLKCDDTMNKKVYTTQVQNAASQSYQIVSDILHSCSVKACPSFSLSIHSDRE